MRNAPRLIAPLLVLFLGPALAAIAFAAGEAKFQTYTGSYENPTYCFALTIPGDAVGLANAKPGPHRGFFIDLFVDRTTSLQETWEHPSSRLIHAAAPEGPGSKTSPEEAAAHRRREIEGSGAHVVGFQQKKVKLGGLPASRVTLTYMIPGSATQTVEESIFAARGGYLYELNLITEPARFHDDDEVFEAMVRTWRMIPCRP